MPSGQEKSRIVVATRVSDRDDFTLLEESHGPTWDLSPVGQVNQANFGFESSRERVELSPLRVLEVVPALVHDAIRDR